MGLVEPIDSKVGQGLCPGSFGELLQGVLPGQKKFLVNFKIQNRSQVGLALSSSQYSPDKEETFINSYRLFSKSYKVVRNVLTDLGFHLDSFLNVESNIPVGKGLSSSTADMIASLRALEKALSISLKADYVGRMLTEIEPNDGLQWPGTSAYHHTTGQRIWSVNAIPRFKILGVDLGGTIDTVQFNQKKQSWSEQDMAHYEQLLQQMNRALQDQNLKDIGELSTESTQLWQKISPKEYLPLFLEFMKEHQAYGLLNTHSGTYLGLLFSDDISAREQAQMLSRLQGRLPEKSMTWFESYRLSEVSDV